MDKKSILCLSLAVSFILLCVMIAGCTATSGSVVGRYHGYASEERYSLSIYEDGKYVSLIPPKGGTWTVEGNTLMLTNSVVDHYESRGLGGYYVYKDEDIRYKIVGDRLKFIDGECLAKEYVKDK